MAKIRQHFARPLISRKIKTFHSLGDAARFANRLNHTRRAARPLNIVQQGTDWVVCAIVSGGVQ